MKSSPTEKCAELLEIIESQAQTIKQQSQIIKKTLIKNLELENYIREEQR